MIQDFPYASFPHQLNVRGQHREPFGSYGTRNQFDISSNGVPVFQREIITAEPLVAQHPVLPLSSVTEDVYLFPLQDKIVGEVLEDRSKKKTFSDSIRRLASVKKNSYKNLHIEDIKESLQLSESVAPNEKTTCLMQLETELQPWFRALAKDYIDIYSSSEVKINNSRFAGGVLACTNTDDTHCLLLSPTGTDFSQLKVTSVSEESQGILRGDKVQTLQLDQPVCRVVSQSVHNYTLFAALTDQACSLYSLDTGEDKNPLSLKFQIQTEDSAPWTSCELSPYISGEVLLINSNQCCYLHSPDHLERAFGPCEPRFQTHDSWNTAYFGEHPRQVIHADLTAVQIFDIRKPSPMALDLFALPSDLLQIRERVRMCQKLTTAPFYHVIATDFSLILADQRFPKHPVLQWDHVLCSPPQYLSCLSRNRSGSHNGQVITVFIGSQLPAQIHAVEVKTSSSSPPQATRAPWRLASIKDVSEWPQFMDECRIPASLRHRMKTSIAGIQASTLAGNQVVFQVDSYGEIFFQSFLVGSEDEDVSFSAGPGSQLLEPSDEAVRRAKTWIESYQSVAKGNTRSINRVLYKNVTNILQSNDQHLTPHASCTLCMPAMDQLLKLSTGATVTDQLEADATVPDQPSSSSSSVCRSCGHSVDVSEKLVDSVKHDKILQNTSETFSIDPSLLKSVDSYPSASALSRLLLKQWNKDSDIGDILKDWDEEAVKKKLARKKNKNLTDDLVDMSEEAVLHRVILPAQTTSATKEGDNQTVIHPMSDRLVTDSQDDSASLPDVENQTTQSTPDKLITDREDESASILGADNSSEFASSMVTPDLSKEDNDMLSVSVNSVLVSTKCNETPKKLKRGHKHVEQGFEEIAGVPRKSVANSHINIDPNENNLYIENQGTGCDPTEVPHKQPQAKSSDEWIINKKNMQNLTTQDENDVIDDTNNIQEVICDNTSAAVYNSQKRNEHGASSTFLDSLNEINASQGLVDWRKLMFSSTQQIQEDPVSGFLRDRISPARSLFSNQSFDLFSSPEHSTQKRKRKRQQSGDSTCSDMSRISVSSFPGYLGSPRKSSKKSLGMPESTENQKSMHSQEATNLVLNQLPLNQSLFQTSSSKLNISSTVNSILQFSLAMPTPQKKSDDKVSGASPFKVMGSQNAHSPAKVRKKRFDGF